MTRTKVFRNNRTQAVRLPKQVALPDEVTEVDVIALGAARVITPAHGGWRHWWEHGDRATADFLAEREQPEPQVRDW